MIEILTLFQDVLVEVVDYPSRSIDDLYTAGTVTVTTQGDLTTYG